MAYYPNEAVMKVHAKEGGGDGVIGGEVLRDDGKHLGLCLRAGRVVKPDLEVANGERNGEGEEDNAKKPHASVTRPRRHHHCILSSPGDGEMRLTVERLVCIYRNLRC